MREEKNWVIFLSNGLKFYVTEKLKNELKEMVNDNYRWIVSDNFLIKISHIVAIYKLEE
jgi:hypothetical protein